MRIDQRRPGRIRPDLEVLRSALEALGNPQDCFEAVLVVGTNGKGSTAAMLDSILVEHDLSTGLFTSPHLCELSERIRISNGVENIDASLKAVERFPELTFFEALTAAAFLSFADAGIEWAVLEAGMGGSWDATLLAEPAIVGLSNVGSDHRKWLGDTREQIARDKGRALAAAKRGIIGPGVDEAVIDALGAPKAEYAVDLIGAKIRETWIDLNVGEASYSIVPPLAGRHQIDNLVLALALASSVLEEENEFNIEALQRGLDRVVWPGRWSKHDIKGRSVILDCAHNLEAATALAAHLHTLDETFNLVFSCLDDKPVEEMAAVLSPVVGEIVICSLSDERAMPIERIAAAFPDAVRVNDPITALAAASDPALVAGSLRLVGAVLQYAG